ncbi:hypothetical protein SS1G_07242 [Sclerotinia sclerotiorum 1980 UF-70]|uniref:Chalcone isomerase domain-containing protein n=2 Tax=Sclerotinia sclerotiorum (strain ATCC 18683 / 1980 / Ss-1) TaxID=665079 RepID=A7EPJ3_SCLS1|nr:hypothetical protein SS1G_07242 [Sclerotinia sclerotiorum 1980 UF-70]APA10303.1 hypothetical protein sscle_06g050730 [Sclerotinia sclerotiorum 1980 UF-70]EDO04759.1 hypothetical protein SS1G_07242 [Sclerotinia sclerotiorum 1980 UF-70]
MSFLPRTPRILHTLPRSQCQRLTPIRTHLRTLTHKPATPTPHLDAITLHRLEATQRAHQKRRTIYLATGFLTGMICIWVTATSIDLKPAKLDSTRAHDTLHSSTEVIIQKPHESTPPTPSEPHELIPTGTSTIPTFPKYIQHSSSPDTPPETYQLLGLGIRTVSFLNIQVYVIGLYIQQSSIPLLQSRLIEKASPPNSGASTLVAGEKDFLKKQLLHETDSEEIWTNILQTAGLKTIIRIVPTRNTDFHHLRDAWVRSLTARAQRNRDEFGDELFGRSIAEFKALFNRGSVPKGRELLLNRDVEGRLSVWCEEGERGIRRLGEVRDERVSRGIWLGYLAGKNVSSEEARRNIIEGVMGFVERPVGTVEGQVHV